MTRRRGRLAAGPVLAAVLAVVVAAALAASFAVLHPRDGGGGAPSAALPLRPVGSLRLPGDASRFDYAGLDPVRHLLFVAHLGAGQVIEIDTAADRVVRVIDGVAGVHGVLAVPGLARVYATATDADQVLTIDEASGAVLARTPTGNYPDGLAYDPDHGRIWVTDETGGSETVIDTAGRLVGHVDVGGEAGNVGYDPGHPGGQVLVDVQSRDQVVTIDPASLRVVARIDVRGCDHPHGLNLDTTHRLGFIACDGNATLHVLDLDTFTISREPDVGDAPDVLALDPRTGWLYVAAESGTVTVLREHGRRLDLLGRDRLADGAHVVAVDPTTHRSYYPIAQGPGGRPQLLVYTPTR